MPQASLLNYFNKTPFQPIRPLQQVPNPLVALQETTADQVNAVATRPVPPVSSEKPGHNGERNKCPNKEKGSATPLQHAPSLHLSQLPGFSIVPVDSAHIQALKRLTATTLPVRYPDNFFNVTLTDQNAAALSRVALYDLEPVGWIRCRLEADPYGTFRTATPVEGANRIYIQALCLLAPYRGYGLAATLLDCIVHGKPVKDLHITHIYAHVWERNEAALLWYEKRGFKRIILINEYYRKLQPSGAWIVRRDL